MVRRSPRREHINSLGEQRMKIITGERQSGKTTKLIRIAAETGAYIVCRSIEEAQRIHKLSRDKGVKIPLPVTYKEFLQSTVRNRYVVDNADDLLQYISRGRIEAISVRANHYSSGNREG